MHEIFALFRLSKGRRLLLSLKGATHTKLSTPIMYIPRAHWEIYQPIALLIDGIPVRKFRLYNVSDEPLKAVYHMNNLAEENYGVAIFQSKGNMLEIQPQSYFDLEVKFCPLTEKVYRTQLNIEIPAIRKRQVVEVVGHGVSVVEDLSLVPISHPLMAMVQTLLPEQFARLSQEVLVFPTVATNNQDIRVLYIENLCSDKVNFEWTETEILSVEPRRAEIMPSKKFLLQVKVTAGTRSEDVDEPLKCRLSRSDSSTNVLFCHVRTLITLGILFKPNPAANFNSTTKLEGGRVLRPNGTKHL